MKSKCKCSLSFLDNKKLCHGFFSPSYCIIIIINKKEDFSYADVSFYPYNRSIRLFLWPLLKDSFTLWGSRGPVPGARVAANPRLLSCKYHTHRNVGRKEDLEGPEQVCSRSPGPPPLSARQMTRRHCIVDLQVIWKQSVIQCTVHLLNERTNRARCSACLCFCRCHHKDVGLGDLHQWICGKCLGLT